MVTCRIRVARKRVELNQRSPMRLSGALQRMASGMLAGTQQVAPAAAADRREFALRDLDTELAQFLAQRVDGLIGLFFDGRIEALQALRDAVIGAGREILADCEPHPAGERHESGEQDGRIPEGEPRPN